MTKKILVTLTDEQFDRLMKRGDLGATASEKLRNAFILNDGTRDLLELLRRQMTGEK